MFPASTPNTPIGTDLICLYPIAGSIRPIWTAEPGFYGPVSCFLPRCLATTTSLTKPPLHLGIVFILSVTGRPFCLCLLFFMLLLLRLYAFPMSGTLSLVLSASSSSFAKAITLDLDQYVPGIGHGLHRTCPRIPVSWTSVMSHLGSLSHSCLGHFAVAHQELHSS